MGAKVEHGEFEPGPPVEGGVEVICGSMFSGKSEELIKRVRRAKIARQNVQVFKPAIDNRRGESTVNSYDGNSVSAISVSSALEIFAYLNDTTRVVAVDEAQFFDDQLAEICTLLANSGRRVIVAGLNTDFKGESFGVMGKIIAEVADHVDTLHAICTKCGGDASRTQRMIKEKSENGEWAVRPASYSDPLIVVGGAEGEANGGREIVEFYEARCRKHHEVPGRPVYKVTPVNIR